MTLPRLPSLALGVAIVVMLALAPASGAAAVSAPWSAPIAAHQTPGLAVRLVNFRDPDPLQAIRVTGSPDIGLCLYRSTGVAVECGLMTALLGRRTGLITAATGTVGPGNYILLIRANTPTHLSLGPDIRVENQLDRAAIGKRSLRLFTADLLHGPTGGHNSHLLAPKAGMILQGVGWHGHAPLAIARAAWCLGTTAQPACDTQHPTPGFVVDRELVSGGEILYSLESKSTTQTAATESLLSADQLDAACGFALVAT